MTTCRIRVTRETLDTGRFDWAVRDESGAVAASGQSGLENPAVSGECELILASDLVLLAQVAPPNARVRRHGQALRYLVEEAVVSDPDQVHVAVETTASGEAVTVAVVDRRSFAELLARFERAGILPVRAYPEPLLVKAMAATWTVVLNGEDRFARTAAAYGFVLDEVAPEEPPAALRLALDRVRGSALAPERIVVRTGTGLAPPPLERWSSQLGVDVRAGDPWHWSAENHEPEIDLLQGEFAPRAAATGLRRRLRRSAMLASALALLYCAGVAFDWAAKASERRRLMAEMSAIHRETFGEGTPIVDAPLQMSRVLADLRRRAGQPAPDDFLVLLAAVAEGLPEPLAHRVETIAYEKGVLTVSLRLRDRAHSETLVERLRRSVAPVNGPRLQIDAAASGDGSVLTLAVRPERRQ